MLGLKGLSWHSVETPMILPKPDLVILTGGYRGTPVLQIGADVYVDNQCIAMELERRFPEPSLFPYGNTGMDQALVKWSDAFFRAGLFMVIARQSKDWPDEFLIDRKALFSDLDFDFVTADIDHARAQLRAYASFINTQLADGRAFLEGSKPSLADIHAFSVPWFTRAAMPEVNDLLAAFNHLPTWEGRVSNIGEGIRKQITATEAHRIARETESEIKGTIDPGDAQGLREGLKVRIEADDSRRGITIGTIVAAAPNQIAVRHCNETVGEVVVYFPRIGYRINPVV